MNYLKILLLLAISFQGGCLYSQNTNPWLPGANISVSRDFGMGRTAITQNFTFGNVLDQVELGVILFPTVPEATRIIGFNVAIKKIHGVDRASEMRFFNKYADLRFSYYNDKWKGYDATSIYEYMGLMLGFGRHIPIADRWYIKAGFGVGLMTFREKYSGPFEYFKDPYFISNEINAELRVAVGFGANRNR